MSKATVKAELVETDDGPKLLVSIEAENGRILGIHLIDSDEATP